MSSLVRVNAYVCRQYYGRLSRDTVYKALQIGEDVIDVEVHEKDDALGFSEFFRFKLLPCKEIRTIYVTSIGGMIGYVDSPYDDMMFGFQEVDKYAEYMSNYLMILRDIFPGYDVRRIDDGSFAAYADAFKKRNAIHERLMESKVPSDIASVIVEHNLPKWVSYDGSDDIEKIPSDYFVIFEEIITIASIDRNAEFVQLVLHT
jgi:hypothetical protein